MKDLKFFLFVTCFIVLSCSNPNKEVHNIVVKGVVLDSANNKPLAGAKVTILCWKNAGYDDVNYVKADMLTDSQGRFSLAFEKGFKLDIGSIASNYHPSIKEIKNIKTPQDVTLKLIVNNAKTELKEWGEIGLFKRKFTTKQQVPIEYYGIDLLNGRNSRIIDSCDIYSEKNVGITYPKKIIAPNKGGIIPIWQTGTSINRAPLEGYLNEYTLTGQEKGLFVRCRDGKMYGMLMIVFQYDKSYPYKDGFYMDYGIKFNASIQSGGGNEFNTPNEINLEEYLLKLL